METILILLCQVQLVLEDILGAAAASERRP